MCVKALIYTRVSEDRAGGRSPAEQEADARNVCQREAWDVAAVVTDSVGASRHSKGTRHGWNRAKKMLANNEVDVLVTWEASRAQRDLHAYAELRDLCAKNGVLWNYKGKTHDLASKDDRFTTGLDALLAERESDEISERVQRAIRANAVAGRPHGRRLYGYERVYDSTSGRLITQEPHPKEAPVVRRIFADYLAGSGIKTLVRALNDEGITTAAGAAWTDTTVHGLLTNPGYAARRIHQRKVIGAATWPALIPPDTFDTTQQRLATQRTYAPRGEARARLLSGIARCGKCGGKMGVIHDRNYRKVYACKTKYDVSRDLIKLDAFVSAAIIERLSQPGFAQHVAAEPGGDVTLHVYRGRVDGINAQLEAAADEFARGNLSAAMLARVESRLIPDLADAERALRATIIPINVPIPDDDVTGWWEQLETESKRLVLRSYLTVTVHPSTVRGRHTFDPDSVEIGWKT